MTKHTKKLTLVSVVSLLAIGLSGCAYFSTDLPSDKDSSEVKEKETLQESETPTSKSHKDFISLTDAKVEKGYEIKFPKDWIPYEYVAESFVVSLPVEPSSEVSVTESDEGRMTQYKANDSNGDEYSVVVITSTLTPENEIDERGRSYDTQKELFSGVNKVEEGEASDIRIAGKDGYSYKTTAEIEGRKVFLNSAAVFRGSTTYVIAKSSFENDEFETYVKGFKMI